MGGVEQVINQIARGANKFGVKTDVLSLSLAREPRTIEIDGYLVHRARLDVQIASTGFSVSALLRFIQLAKKADVIHYHFPWPFMDDGTLLNRVKGIKNTVTPDEYIRMLALSRIMLPNIINIQASWLTVGKATAQICLQAGANDFGSIMIEENVVSAAGAPHRFTYKTIQDAIKEAGFEPQLRNQQYEFREIPANIEEQVVNY